MSSLHTYKPPYKSLIMHRNNMFVFVTFHILMIFPKSRFQRNPNESFSPPAKHESCYTVVIFLYKYSRL
jgi:hypothetical protein